MYCLVENPQCIISIYINNIHVCFQCHERCICIIVALIVTFKRNSLSAKSNWILNLFCRKIFWMDTCFYIFILSIFNFYFGYLLRINSITHPCIYNFLNTVVHELHLHIQFGHLYL